MITIWQNSPLYICFWWNTLKGMGVLVYLCLTSLLAVMVLCQSPVISTPPVLFIQISIPVAFIFLVIFIEQFCKPFLYMLSLWPEDVPFYGGFWIVPSEVLSYLARPCSTSLRPSVNLIGGLYLGCLMHNELGTLWSFSVSVYLFVVYEAVVTLVQWFIVGLVVNFSVWCEHI